MKVERKIVGMCRILTSQALETPLEHQYQLLTNLVLSYGGRIHGSQHSSIVTKEGEDVDKIVVYFEVPRENLDEFTKEEAGL